MSGIQSARYVNTRIERASRAEIEALQLVRIQRVVNAAYETNPFYRSLYDKAKVRPAEIQSLADFRNRIPYVDKAMLLADQQAYPPYGLRGTTRKSDVFAVLHTSGTSGAAQEIHCL